MTEIKKISTGYRPRELQAEIHRALKRFNVLVLHRRFGKTILAINEVIDKALRCKNKNPQYAYLAPFYGQAKRVAWQYFKDFTENIPNVTYNEAELRVTITRPHMQDKVRIYLLGADNPGSLRGIYLDGIVLDEYAEMSPSIWGEIIRPALSDRLGWAIFIGTPKGENHFYEIFEMAKCNADWYAKTFKASESGIIPHEELEAAKQTMTPDEYLQEYECSFSAALKGAYYKDQIAELEEKGQISNNVTYDSALPVSTFWDLGMDDATSIWFCQILGNEIRLIDYMEDRGKDLSWWASKVNEKKYVWNAHYLPWDAAARSLETGRTRQEVMERLLNGRVEVLKRHDFKDGIDATRMLMPRMWFNENKCRQGIKALKSYTQKYDAKNKIYSDKPLHNWASHAADALRYLALGLREKPIDVQNLPRLSQNSYDVF